MNERLPPSSNRHLSTAPHRLVEPDGNASATTMYKARACMPGPSHSAGATAIAADAKLEWGEGRMRGTRVARAQGSAVTHAHVTLLPHDTFRMGPEKHFPDEASVRRVAVSSFWIERMPVTNSRCKECGGATEHKPVAEIPLDPRRYPGTLYVGSLVFAPTNHSVTLKEGSSGAKF